MPSRTYEELRVAEDWCAGCWNSAGWASCGVAFFLGKKLTRADSYEAKLKWCKGNCEVQ